MQTNGLGNNRRGGRCERTRPLSPSSVITLFFICDPAAEMLTTNFV